MDKLTEALNTPGVIFDRWVIRLDKETAAFDPWFLPPETYKDDLEGFLQCLALKRTATAAEERLKAQRASARSAQKEAKALAKEQAKEAEKAAKAAAKAEKKAVKEAEKAATKAAKKKPCIAEEEPVVLKVEGITYE